MGVALSWQGKSWRPVSGCAGWLALAALLATPATAQVISPAPEHVAVTIYRAPDRRSGDEMDRAWLKGYALITEQRTVTIPAGHATIRLEGVAAGILPESAIVTGLPQGVREKNLDADLLSPRTLFAHSFGRPVTIRRTVGGKMVEERAIIRSGPDGAAILQTSTGFIAANCGAEESISYDSVPPGLPARPTLSIETDAPTARRATITLTYLAWGFDWQANYVATMRPGGRSADLFAWVTLASSDTTSFADADTAMIAGKVAREDSAPEPTERPDEDDFQFTCFGNPAVSTMSSPEISPPVAMAGNAEAMDIVVTGSRIQREDIGDLKLYRVPQPTTVAAMALKQVALLDRRAVPVDIIYSAVLRGDDEVDAVWIELRAVNRKDRGLGVPLPAGPLALFQPRGATRLLIGESAIADKAEGEEVETAVARTTQVSVDVDNPASGGDWEDYVLTVRNANPHPIRFELPITLDEADARLSRVSAPLGRKKGISLWAVEVPANSSRQLRYRLKDKN